jgi:hypothetical protein
MISTLRKAWALAPISVFDPVQRLLRAYSARAGNDTTGAHAGIDSLLFATDDFHTPPTVHVSNNGILASLSLFDDIVSEPQYEYAHLVASVPGIIPLLGSDMWVVVSIEDNDRSAKVLEPSDTGMDRLCVHNFGSRATLWMDYTMSVISVENSSRCNSSLEDVDPSFSSDLVVFNGVSVFASIALPGVTDVQTPQWVVSAHGNESDTTQFFIVAANSATGLVIFIRCDTENVTYIMQQSFWVVGFEVDAEHLPLQLSSALHEAVGHLVVLGIQSMKQVQIWHLGATSWQLDALLRPKSDEETTLFAASVKLRGNILAVGAPIDVLQENALLSGVGLVHVFVFIAGTQLTEVGLDPNRKDNRWSVRAGWPEGDALIMMQLSDMIHDTRSSNSCWVYQARLVPTVQHRDGLSSFGSAVDVSHNTVVVGTPQQVYEPVTTWDFETGAMTGWEVHGSAAKFQPVNIQSSVDCMPELDVGKASHVGRGLFMVNTQHQQECALPPAPGRQSNLGVFLSEPFMIDGNVMKLMVGGGCDEDRVYVQLIVNGFPEHRATGSCSMSMSWVYWNVSSLKGDTGRIRIVDEATSGNFPFILVDEIQFDWDVGRQRIPSGAVHVFQLITANSSNYSRADLVTDSMRPADWQQNMKGRDVAACSTRPLSCTWLHWSQLLPQYLQQTTHFGIEVNVEPQSAIVTALGYVRSPVEGPSLQQQSVFRANVDVRALDRTKQYRTNRVMEYSTGGSPSMGERWLPAESQMFGGGIYSKPGIPIGSAQRYSGSGTEAPKQNFQTPPSASDTTSVSFYRPLPAKISGDGTLLHAAHWSSEPTATVLSGSYGPLHVVSSHFRVGFTDHESYSGFGRMDGFHLSSLYASFNPSDFSSPTNDYAHIAPQLAFVNIEKHIASKYKRLVRVREADTKVEVRVYRHGLRTRRDIRYPSYMIANTTIDVAYGTKDGSALGMNATMAERCQHLHVQLREGAGCGNFIHKSGVVQLFPLSEYASIWIEVLDDDAFRPKPRSFTVHMLLPNGWPLLGEDFVASVQIEEDDMPSLVS